MHLPSRPVVERKTKKSNSPCWSLRAASSRVLGLGLCLCLLLLVDWSTLAWPLLAMFWLAETARWDMLCTASVHTSRHHTCDMWHVTCDMLLRYMQSVDITSRWWRDGVNPPLLGETDTLVTCFACCLGSDSRSILDMDTALPGDLCLEPGVVQPPRSVLDITMVGTRSVLLLWAVSTPGDRAPSSPSDVTTVTCYFASHAVLQSTQ